MSKLKKRIKVIFGILLSLGVLIVAGCNVVMSLPEFGALPKGERLERIKRSPNYRDGQFQNKNPMPNRGVSGSMLKIAWKFFFGRDPNVKPHQPLPVEHPNFSQIEREDDLIIWFGHSSYLLQLNGKRYLVDPVFVSAAPLGIGNGFFEGTKVFRPEEMPEIDYLIISHDHWDHLDYHTVKELRTKVGKVVTGLGVGAHFERWDYDKEKIVELDWDETYTAPDGLKLHALPARHFSGRGFKAGQSLWSSFMIEDNGRCIYIGGDSGYDNHFAQIGQRFPNIELAIVENGQYNENWSAIHTLPQYLGNVIRDLGAKRALTVHHGKFALAMHDWREPLRNARRLIEEEHLPIIMPKIGQVVNYTDPTFVRNYWWE